MRIPFRLGDRISTLMIYLEVKKWRGSSSITLFGSFLRNEGERFGGVWRGFNYL